MLTFTQVKKCVQEIPEFTYVGYTRQIEFTGQIGYTQVCCVYVRNVLILTVSSPESVYLYLGSFRLFYSFRRDTLSYQPTPEQPVLAQLQQVFAFLSQTQVNLHILR